MLTVRYSATETFLTCRRRYDYEYKQRLTRFAKGEEPVTHAMVGNAFHHAMEALYSGEDGRAALEEYINVHGMAGRTIKVQRNMIDAADISRGLYNRYVVWAKTSKYDEGTTVVDLEKRLGWEIIPGVTITGKADKLRRTAFGVLELIDYKTVGQYDKFDDYADMNRQGLTYAVLAEHEYGESVDSFALVQVHRSPPKSNPMPVNVLPAFFTEEQKAEHVESLKAVAREIKALHEDTLAIFPHAGDACTYCPFKDLCLQTSQDPGNVAAVRARFRIKDSDEE